MSTKRKFFTLQEKVDIVKFHQRVFFSDLEEIFEKPLHSGHLYTTATNDSSQMVAAIRGSTVK